MVNIITLTKLTRLFLPSLLKQPAAYILNIGSSASYQAVPLLTAYAAFKSLCTKLQPWTISGAQKDNGIGNLYLPGPTDTQFRESGKRRNQRDKSSGTV